MNAVSGGSSLRGQQSNNQSTATHQLVSLDQATALTAEDGCTEDLLAIEKILMSCPQCRHEFKLMDGLLVDEPAAVQQQQQQQLLQQQEQEQQQQQQPEPQLICNASSRLSPVTRSDTCSSATTTQLTAVGGATASTQPSARTGDDVDFCGGDAPELAQACQTFQIVNRTIDQLERLICDPFDRRIRKTSSMSQCDIEIRSELPSRKFGAARNFCILRASSSCHIDKCRSLLRLQMGWVLLPKP